MRASPILLTSYKRPSHTPFLLRLRPEPSDTTVTLCAVAAMKRSSKRLRSSRHLTQQTQNESDDEDAMDDDDVVKDDQVLSVPLDPRYNPRTPRTSSASEQAMRAINPKGTFVRGNLVRIWMKNFITFSDTVVLPGPRLNLIIGPNGTGKSTIVNAICIVFGGKLGLLGRSSDLARFVRHGSTESTVEVWLHDTSRAAGVLKVRRIFDVDGRSTFYIDGCKSTASAVAELALDYDIQLDNLSQYMPQEKIADFVALRPHEMLTITVRSLGGNRRVQLLHDLRVEDAELRKLTAGAGKREAELTELRRRNTEMQPEVEAFRQQRAVKKRVRLAEKFLPKLLANELREQLQAHLIAKKQAEQHVDTLKRSLQDVEKGSIKQLELKRRVAKQESVDAKNRIRDTEKETREMSGEVEQLGVTLNAKRNELNDVDRAAERYEAQLKATEQKIEETQQKIADISSQYNHRDDDSQLRECQQRKHQLRRLIVQEDQVRTNVDSARITAERAIRHFNNQINSLSDIRYQRIGMLDRMRRFRNTGACVRIVETMVRERQFKGKVFGPVVAEINCNSPYHARIMEGCVSGFLMGAFITETSADSRLLINECKRRINGWAPDTITAPTDAQDNPDIHALRAQVPDRPVDEQLRQLGITAMVNDIFQTDDVVRAALNAQAGLHNIHVGDERADQNIEVLRMENGIKTWYTPSARCGIMRSRYDPSVRNLKVETRFRSVTGQIYSGSVEEVDREKARLLQSIREEESNMAEARRKLVEATQRIDELKSQIREVDEQMGQISSRQRQRSQQSMLLERTKREYDSLLQKRGSVQYKKKKDMIKKEIMEMENQIVDMLPDVVKGLTALKDAMVHLDDVTANRVVVEREYEAEKQKNSSMHAQLAEAVQVLDERKAAMKVAKNEWKRMQKEADEAMSEEEMEANKTITDPWHLKDLTWLQNEIERLKGRIQGLTTSGPNVLKDYEEREKRIADMEKRLEDDRNDFETRKKKFDTRKTDFLQWLKQGVEHMRFKFSELYSRFGCSGDLELTAIDSVEDLELQILVSYRDGADLRPISAASNSGGEKMVCTMLFCFSLLHDHARMPSFVIVDEMNQGMDARNEMKIMTILFEDAERGVAPQSFVITPKLLPGLPFQDAAKTHVIFNGKIFKGDVSAPA